MKIEITIKDIIENSVGFNSLLNEAQNLKDDETKPRFCRNVLWIGARSINPQKIEIHRNNKGGFWFRLMRYVGVYSNANGAQGFLRSQAAYEIASMTLYNALPPCRNCDCINAGEMPE